jgi:putative transposase
MATSLADRSWAAFTTSMRGRHERCTYAALQLFFVHLATRRVVAAACTAEPNSAWVTQQARNLSWKLSDEGINVRVVVHDRDRKFARSFDAVFEAEGARVILTPLMAPRANAHAERWVGSARRECLDWMLIVSQRHLEAVLGEYCAHYNDERPHRSCGLRPPASPGAPIRRPGATIRRRARLGGYRVIIPQRQLRPDVLSESRMADSVLGEPLPLNQARKVSRSPR